MSGIRLATLHDLKNIRTLLLQLEYTIAESVLENTLTLLLAPIGQEMEAVCEEEAKKRQCERIEVHCHTRREKAHHFYKQCGFEESPKYFVKHL